MVIPCCPHVRWLHMVKSCYINMNPIKMTLKSHVCRLKAAMSFDLLSIQQLAGYLEDLRWIAGLALRCWASCAPRICRIHHHHRYHLQPLKIDVFTISAMEKRHLYHLQPLKKDIFTISAIENRCLYHFSHGKKVSLSSSAIEKRYLYHFSHWK